MAMTRPRRHPRLGLSPGERARLGGMVAAIIGLYVIGFVLLFASVAHHYHLSKTELFGVGTGQRLSSLTALAVSSWR